VVVALVLWFLWFGISDIRNPRKAGDYIHHNPLRPFFRLLFGLLMSGGLISVAVLITARANSR
jgi:hypothetical protein